MFKFTKTLLESFHAVVWRGWLGERRSPKPRQRDHGPEGHARAHCGLLLMRKCTGKLL